jgi:hypothetical protein
MPQRSDLEEMDIIPIVKPPGQILGHQFQLPIAAEEPRVALGEAKAI